MENKRRKLHEDLEVVPIGFAMVLHLDFLSQTEKKKK